MTGVRTSGNTIAGNFIGTGAGGSGAMGNGGNGVLAEGGALNTWIDGTPGTVSGTCSGACNKIAHNTLAGVAVMGTASRTLVRANSIASNGGVGIDLGSDGVTPNDPGDGDTGPNDLQNFPVITSASTSGGTTTVSGTLNSLTSTTYNIDVYANASQDPSGFGEGETYLCSTAVTTDGSGNVSWTCSASGSHTLITATATRNAITTSSEFSAVFTNPAEVSPCAVLASRGTGTSVDVIYDPACGATNHVIYRGLGGPAPLSGLSWTNAECALGTSGNASFDPGDPSTGRFIYFVVVGQNGNREGSYGRNSSNVDRPEAVGVGACDRPQDLSGTCP